ncbi:MAG TPA: hypothetical protein VFA83_22085 [Acidimicrobiales bacterium]|nr:hypothetical protein [Acidimicrobiales bacterium]
MSSALVLVLMVVESSVGYLVHGVYREERWAVAALRGNDLVTLLLVAPLFAVAVTRGRRSDRWRVVWLGGLLYAVNNFAYYAFGTTFNDVFLLHVSTLGLSIAALVTLTLDLPVQRVTAQVVPHRSDRAIALYMAAIGVALISAWGGFSLRFATTGELPHDVMPPTAVHLVYALDMTMLAPAFLAGGVLLWRHRAWGYVFGAAVNLFGAAYLVVLEFVGGFEANAGIADKTWISPPAIAGAALCALAAVTLLRRLAVATRS